MDYCFATEMDASDRLANKLKELFSCGSWICRVGALVTVNTDGAYVRSL
jgi:hypothetical protein